MADTDTKTGLRQPIAFISHHSSQEQTARHLKNILGRNGIQGWMAPDDIEPGRPFDEAIIEEVEQCDVIVLLFCAQSDKSRHVKRELMMAENHRKLIYPVRLEDIDAKGLAYWLNDYQWIDWIDRRDETIHRLIETVKRQVKTEDRRAAEAIEATNPPPETDPAPEPESEPESESEPEAPQKPVAVDAAPIGLMGLAPPADTDNKSKDDDGSGSGFRMSPVGWAVVAAIALVLAVAVAMAIGSNRDGSNSDSGSSIASSDSDDSGSGNSGSASSTELEPGMWNSQFTFTRVDMPNAPPEVLSAFQGQLGNMGSSSNDCMTEAEARDPESSILADGELKQQCRVTDTGFTNGRFNLAASCQVPNTVGESRLLMQGRYDRTSINADISLSMNTAAGGMIISGQMRSTRTGTCN